MALRALSRVEAREFDSPTNFKCISEDVIVNIFSRLEEDPRHLARLACVCQRFLYVVRNVCWKRHCVRLVPELLPSPKVQLDVMAPPPGGWGGLMKLLVCCPGLKHSGVLLDCWDFGLDRELGTSAEYHQQRGTNHRRKGKRRVATTSGQGSGESRPCGEDPAVALPNPFGRSTVCGQAKDSLGEAKVDNPSTCFTGKSCQIVTGSERKGDIRDYQIERNQRTNLKEKADDGSSHEHLEVSTLICVDDNPVSDIGQGSSWKRKEISGDSLEENVVMRELSPCLAVDFKQSEKACSYTSKVKMQESLKNTWELGSLPRPVVSLGDRFPAIQASHCARSCMEGVKHEAEPQISGERQFKRLELHLASGTRNLSREQGNKLLASRFRSDCLYICDWPGCVHPGEKRKYKLFRGIFKNFKGSHVWRNLKDMNYKPIGVPCAFCSSASCWDMMTAFCLRRSLEYHDDGEPVVRAYVCENGHVSGAWTDRPMFTL